MWENCALVKMNLIISRICLFPQFQTFICWDDKECIWWWMVEPTQTTSPSWSPSSWSSWSWSWWPRWRLLPDLLHNLGTFAEKIQLATDCTRVYYLPQRIYSTHIYYLVHHIFNMYSSYIRDIYFIFIHIYSLTPERFQ